MAAPAPVSEMASPVGPPAEPDAAAFIETPVAVAEPLGTLEFAEATPVEPASTSGFVQSVALGELENPDVEGEDFGDPREFALPSFDAFGERDDDSDIEEID